MGRSPVSYAFKLIGAPYFLRLKHSYLYSGNHPFEASLKLVLMPVFDRLGLSYKPLTVSPAAKIFAFLIILFISAVLLSTVISSGILSGSN